MDLHDVAGSFDLDPIYDGYNGRFLFNAHTTPHDDQTSSGSTVRRRSLITEPDTVAPPRRVIKWQNTHWLVGNVNDDSYMGEVIRRNYGLKKSTGTVEMLTPGQAAQGTPGTVFHVNRDYYRDNSDTRTSADWDTMWNVYCPFTEPVTKGMFLRQDGRLMRVRNVYEGLDEFLVAEADQLDTDALQPITFVSTGKPDLVSGVKQEISTAVTAVQTDMAKHFEFRIAADADIKPGDRMLFVAQAVFTPKVGDQFMMQGARWRVLVAQVHRDAWAVHARRQ